MAKHQAWMVIAFIVLSLALETYAQGQTSGALGVMPPALLPQIQQLAQLLQQNVAEGKLSDAQIPSELQQGNLAAVIRGLGPEAASLLDQITSTLKSNYTEVELNAMLQGLLGSAPTSIVPPTQ